MKPGGGPPVKVPKPLGPGKKPSPKPHPHPGKHKGGKPFHHHKRPGFFNWWQPWFPWAGWWPDWGPWWWPTWGIWLTDLIEVGGSPYVIVWVDRCSPEYAQAIADGTLDIPEYYEGYRVLVQYTCGQEPEITQAAAGMGSDGFEQKLYRHTATFLRYGKPVEVMWFDPQPDPPGKIYSITGCCGFGAEAPPTTTPPPPPSPPPIATVMGKDIKVPMMSLGMTALAGGVVGLVFGGFGGALAGAGSGAFGFWMGHQQAVKSANT
jgi:hypothetical protein